MAVANEVHGFGRGRRAITTMSVIVVLGAGAGIADASGAFGSDGSPLTGQGAPPATARVAQQDLMSQTNVAASLGYAGSYIVLGEGGGTLTWLPSPGQVIGQGQVLYRVDNGSPVVLLYGKVPAWRTLQVGLTGEDVRQLNHDLVALGYVRGSDIKALGRDYFSWVTWEGVQRLQSELGIAYPSGTLSLGSFAFEPEALRVAAVHANLGDPVGGTVLTATSNRPTVMISLDAVQQSQVKVGNLVTVTLPDGSLAPGVISSIGRVASVSGSAVTIPVYVTLTHPSETGKFDQAPVTAQITVGTVHDVLVVPVTALLAQASGGYAVEVVQAGGSRRLVPVSVGIFDGADGLVQVSGALSPGQQVVVPAA
jgi:hypothetical protein